MKLSEQLSVIRQKESELNRLYDSREAIVKIQFRERTVNDKSFDEVENQKKEHFEKKKSRMEELSGKIDELKEEIRHSKNQINAKNIEIGLDKKLISLKYVRLELARLMKLAKGDRYQGDIDFDEKEQLGIFSRVKKLESQKTKLDSEIQQLNWSTEL